MSSQSPQEEFATNLKGHVPGTAIFQPLEFRETVHKVADIAFWDTEGNYQWVHNGFYQNVHHALICRLPLGPPRP